MIRVAPVLLWLLAALFALGSPVRAEVLVKSGEKLAFLGDSITAAGWSSPTGYIHLVMLGLDANGVKADAIPAGISGHKSNQMLARLRSEVLSKKPQWLILNCGVTDVLHGKGGVPLDEAMAAAEPYVSQPDIGARGTYEKNLTAMVDQAQAAGVKPVILTSTVILEQLDNDLNTRLIPYNDFLRALAKEKKTPLADLNAMFQAEIKKQNRPKEKVLTKDIVHMNPAGDRLMATGILQALGLSETQLAKAEAAWAGIPPAAKATPTTATGEGAR